jgi:hypothetical protein
MVFYFTFHCTTKGGIKARRNLNICDLWQEVSASAKQGNSNVQVSGPSLISNLLVRFCAALDNIIFLLIDFCFATYRAI